MAVTDLRVSLAQVVEQERRDERDDHSTIEDVYTRHAEELTRFATGLVGAEHSRDLVGSAVAKCLKARNWDSLSDPRGYLYRAVLNESRTLYQRALVRSREHRSIDRPQSGSVDHAISVTDEITVENALLVLPARQRAVIVLTYWPDMSIADVADRLGISEGSTKKHLARARARLRKELS